jgi:hypothetical protein
MADSNWSLTGDDGARLSLDEELRRRRETLDALQREFPRSELWHVATTDYTDNATGETYEAGISRARGSHDAVRGDPDKWTPIGTNGHSAGATYPGPGEELHE